MIQTTIDEDPKAYQGLLKEVSLLYRSHKTNTRNSSSRPRIFKQTTKSGGILFYSTAALDEFGTAATPVHRLVLAPSPLKQKQQQHLVDLQQQPKQRQSASMIPIAVKKTGSSKSTKKVQFNIENDSSAKQSECTTRNPGILKAYRVEKKTAAMTGKGSTTTSRIPRPTKKE